MIENLMNVLIDDRRPDELDGYTDKRIEKTTLQIMEIYHKNLSLVRVKSMASS